MSALLIIAAALLTGLVIIGAIFVASHVITDRTPVEKRVKHYKDTCQDSAGADVGGD